MSLLQDNCTLQYLTKEILDASQPFDCGKSDLNEFFQKDCVAYAEQLLGKSYCFTHNEHPKQIIAAFTIANAGVPTINLPAARKKRLQKKIPSNKHYHSYPAVLIGRLGVNKEFSRQGVGCDLMDFIKIWFLDHHNKTGCRFIMVDAYNNSGPLNFYQKCGFEFLFTDVEKEKKYYKKPIDKPIKTRLMFFDLINART